MDISPTKTTPPVRRARDTGATVLTLSGLVAAFGVASCCGLPFLLATVGLGSAWLVGIATLAAPHRTLLLAVSATCLMAGAVLLWRRQPPNICPAKTACAKPLIRGMTLVGLAAGVALLTIGYLYV